MLQILGHWYSVLQIPCLGFGPWSLDKNTVTRLSVLNLFCCCCCKSEVQFVKFKLFFEVQIQPAWWEMKERGKNRAGSSIFSAVISCRPAACRWLPSKPVAISASGRINVRCTDLTSWNIKQMPKLPLSGGMGGNYNYAAVMQPSCVSLALSTDQTNVWQCT